MTTQPRTPQYHYTEAIRLLAVAQSPGVDPGIQQTAALVAIASALLCLAPRRARKQPEPPAARHGRSTSSWLYGDHEGGEQ
ncbi:MAG TPA: hypothetical protein VGJ59_22075 [Jatrophihabitantaceae bacterium]